MQRLRKHTQVTFAILAAIISASVVSANAADLNMYAIYKRLIYVQATEGEPDAPCCCACFFNAVLDLPSSNSIVDATLVSPNGTVVPLALSYEQEFLPHRWIYSLSTALPDREVLEKTWGNGNYTLSVLGAKDGLRTVALDLSGDAYPVHAPHIRNFAETQAVDASKDFVLHWDPFKEASTNDFVFVLITRMRDNTALSNTPLLTETNHINGMVKSVVIPSGTFAPAEQYDVYVRFDKVVTRDSTSYPGAVGRATYAKGTHFTLKTLSEPAETKKPN